ncbi:MAG: hypothetical protein AAF668_06400 [Pseudomonadota bacterium]
MTIETVYFLAEITAAISVVISLLIVAYQLRQGNKQATVNIALDLAAAGDRSFDPIYLGDNMSVWTRGLAGDPDMTESEEAMFDLFMARVMLNGVQATYAVTHGLWQRREALRSLYVLYRQIADTPGGRVWVAANEHLLSDQFRELIEAVDTSGENGNG